MNRIRKNKNVFIDDFLGVIKRKINFIFLQLLPNKQLFCLD